jgi:hypothetical protein
VLQWALFDDDPSKGYKESIARMRSFYEKRISATKDEKTKKSNHKFNN